MSEVKIPQHVQNMYDAFDEFSSEHVPEKTLYKLMLHHHPELEENVWRIHFLPESVRYNGFEMALYSARTAKLQVIWFGSSTEYISSYPYGDYSEISYPRNLKNFIAELFKDVYSDRKCLKSMAENSVTFTLKVGKKK